MTQSNSEKLSIDKSTKEQGMLPEALPGRVDDAVWIDVVRQMDEIYVDLLQHQVELEEKNQALHATYQQLRQAHEELQLTQAQLIQSEKMASLGRLVAGVAHELNNPISFILGNACTLERYNERLQAFFTGLDDLLDPRVDELRARNQIDRTLKDLAPLVDGTREGADRVSGIIDGLLRFTKPQQQQAAEFDVSTLIDTATQWVLRSATFKPQIVSDIPAPARVNSFEGPIHQIVMNLLQNAVDAVENVTQPTVWASLCVTNSQLVCRIRDNGPGIDHHHLDKIFDPFFTTKLAGKGTGLGLYISYLLATEQCGGVLEAENHHLGGAEFCLTLPVCQNSVCQNSVGQYRTMRKQSLKSEAKPNTQAGR